MSSDPSGTAAALEEVHKSLARMADPIVGHLKEAREQRQRCIKEREEWDGVIRECEKMLKVVDPEILEELKGQASSNGRGKQSKTQKSVGDEVVGRVRDFVAKIGPEGRFYKAEVANGLSMDDTSTRRAVDRLYDDGFVRKAEREGNRQYFRLTKAAINQLEEANATA